MDLRDGTSFQVQSHRRLENRIQVIKKTFIILKQLTQTLSAWPLHGRMGLKSIL